MVLELSVPDVEDDPVSILIYWLREAIKIKEIPDADIKIEGDRIRVFFTEANHLLDVIEELSIYPSGMEVLNRKTHDKDGIEAVFEDIVLARV